MNKKIIGIVVASIVLLAIVIVTLKNKGVDTVSGVKSIVKTSIKVQSPATFLPDNTVMLYSISDLKGVWKDISKSKFWTDFSSLRVWTDFGVKENLKKVIGDLESKTGMKITESRIMDMLGNSVTFAVVMDSDSDKVKLIIQSYIGKKTQFVESSLKNLIPATSVKHGDVEIKKIMNETENSAEISYAIVNNVLTFVFGQGVVDLKSIVDLINGTNKNALNTNDNYIEMRKIMAGDEDCNSYYFMNFSKMSSNIEALIKPLMEMQPEQFQGFKAEDVSKNIKQIKCVAGKVNRTVYGLNMTSKILPNFSEMTDIQKKRWNEKKEITSIINFIPKDTLIFNASSNLDLTSIWENAKKNQQKNSSGNNPVETILLAIQEFEKNYDINVEEDIINKISAEMGFVFSGVNLKGAFPTPSISFLVQSNDSNKLKNTIVALLKKILTGDNAVLPFNLQDKEIEGAQTTVLQTPLGDNLSPVIAEKDGWVMVSTNSASLEKLLKTQKGSVVQITKTDSFKKIIPSLKASSQCSYVNLVGLNEQFKSLVEWVLQRKDLIPQANQYQDVATNIATYLIPALDTLKVFNSLGFVNTSQDQVAVSSVNLILKDK